MADDLLVIDFRNARLAAGERGLGHLNFLAIFFVGRLILGRLLSPNFGEACHGLTGGTFLGRRQATTECVGSLVGRLAFENRWLIGGRCPAWHRAAIPPAS